MDYTLLRHISISEAILESRPSYDKAFLMTEADDNDMTYFIMYSLKSLRVAFESLVHYRDKKRDQRNRAMEISYVLIDHGFSKRQAETLGYVYLKPKATIELSTYIERHGVVRQTASRDLQELVQKGYLVKGKSGRSIHFGLSDKDLLDRLIKQ